VYIRINAYAYIVIKVKYRHIVHIVLYDDVQNIYNVKLMLKF